MTKKEREYLQGLEAHNGRQAEQIKENETRFKDHL
jgi:hypothetical protein